MREHWLLDDSIHFLNHGSFGATPRVVLEKQRELQTRMERNPLRFLDRELEPLLDDTRATLGAFVGAKPDGLVFVTNATSGVNAVVRSLDFAPGDELLTTNHAYNACANVLRYVAARTGANVVVAEIPFPVSSAQEIRDAVLARVTPRTKLVLLDHITSPTALIFPIATLVRELEGRGIPVLVDAAHAPGQVPMQLDGVGASFTTGNLHKWLCAPKGAAFLHVREDWRARVHPTVISHGLNSKRTDRSRFQQEFDWCGTFDPTAILAIPTALEFLRSLLGSMEALMQRNHDEVLQVRARMLEVLPQPVPPPDLLGAMASIVVPGEPLALGERLVSEFNLEIPVFSFGGRALLRVSMQRHVRPGDIDALLGALRAIVRGP